MSGTQAASATASDSGKPLEEACSSQYDLWKTFEVALFYKLS